MVPLCGGFWSNDHRVLTAFRAPLTHFVEISILDAIGESLNCFISNHIYGLQKNKKVQKNDDGRDEMKKRENFLAAADFQSNSTTFTRSLKRSVGYCYFCGLQQNSLNVWAEKQEKPEQTLWPRKKQISNLIKWRLIDATSLLFCNANDSSKNWTIWHDQEWVSLIE